VADRTKIEWTDATVNAINGCTRVSPGCGGPGPHGGCYAERLAGTRLRTHPTREGLTRQTSAGPRWTGEVRLNEPALLQPLRWAKPRMIFWNAHGDTFHRAVPFEWIDMCIAVMALTPQHIHQVLTKRAANMRQYMALFEERPEAFGKALAHVGKAAGLPRQRGIDVIDRMKWPLPNVWLGVSVEDQQRANERIPDLMATPAAVRWLSCEPLLDFISLEEAWHGESALDSECWGDCGWCKAGHPPMWNCQRDWKHYEPGAPQRSGLDWIVVGGESGPNARPMELEAARSLRDQCADAGVPFFFKQWGAHLPCGQMQADGRVWTNGSDSTLRTTKTFAGRYLDGVFHDGMPRIAA
jgi:protein gp37